MGAATSEESVLKRLFGPPNADLPLEVARYFAGLSFTDYDRQRMCLLSEKANEGDLMPDERDELATYVLLNDFLAIVQSRALRTLKSRGPTSGTG
jgi:hypothetical protein